MKRTTTTKLTTGALLIAATTSVTTASADDYLTSPPAAPGPGWINEFLRKDNPENAHWDLGVQVRLRYEDKSYFGTFQNGGPTAGANDFKATPAAPGHDNSLEAERITPHIGYSADWFGVFVEGRGSYTTGDVRNPNPESDGPMDLHQGYLTLGNPKEFPLTFKVGRQELSYGDERLIGAFDWNNIGRTFDAAKLRWETDKFWLDVFTSKVVITRDGHFGMSNEYDWFSGAYLSTKVLPFQTTEVYFLARNTSSGSSSLNTAGVPTGAPAFINGATARDIYTLGSRWKSTPGQLGNWDYLFEAAGQFGHYNFNDASASPLNTKSLKQEAYMATMNGGYTFKDVPMTPRLAAEFDYSSGDNNPNDGTHGTFDNLFPTNHKFYGIMDLFSLQNIEILRFSATIKPVPRLTLAADYRAYWLADTHDSLYTVAGARRNGANGYYAAPAAGYGLRPGNSSYVGSEMDLVGTFNICKEATMQVGYAHFFTGDYITQSLATAGGATDANYVYAQLTMTF